MTSYSETWLSSISGLRKAALEIAWEHWAALGAHAHTRSATPVAQVVDPESLILLSLAYADEEPRFREIVAWWGAVGAPLTSVNRMKAIVEGFGGRGQDHFTTFATLATEAGHRNWKRHADYSITRDQFSIGRGPDGPRLVGGAPLMLRMRAAFGSSAKSDVLAVLISSRDSTSTVAQISRALGYTKTSVRDALNDIVAAGLVSESTGHPSQYSTNRLAWHDLLQFDEFGKGVVPRWGSFVQIFAFIVRITELVEEGLTMNEHLLASKARDVVAEFEPELMYHAISIPPPSRYAGKEYAEGFAVLSRSLGEWLMRDLHKAGDLDETVPNWG